MFCTPFLFICVVDVFYIKTQFNHSKLLKFMRNGQNDHETGSFSVKLTKICKENQRWNILYIRGYDVSHAGFRTL